MTRNIIGIVAVALWLTAIFMPLHGAWGLLVIALLITASMLAGIAATHRRWWAALSVTSLASIAVVFWGVWE